MTPAGETLVSPMPVGMAGHFGPELRRFVLLQYHQGHVTMARLVTQLRAFGIGASKRHLVRLLNTGSDTFRDEARDILWAGYPDYVINAQILEYMRRRALAGPVIAQLATPSRKAFRRQSGVAAPFGEARGPWAGDDARSGADRDRRDGVGSDQGARPAPRHGYLKAMARRGEGVVSGCRTGE